MKSIADVSADAINGWLLSLDELMSVRSGTGTAPLAAEVRGDVAWAQRMVKSKVLCLLEHRPELHAASSDAST